MIIPAQYKGRQIGVFGLARTGQAAVAALEAAGACVTAWDDDAARRTAVGGSVVDLMTADLSRMEAIVLAPGVPLTHPAPHPLVARAKAAGIPLISDLDLFEVARAGLANHVCVGITGTNGKSTTSALIDHMISFAGRPSALGGNIGTAVLALEPLPPGGTYVLELSSFQLDLTRALHVNIAVQLNISPDHLDRHGTMEAYVAAKRRLFDMQRPSALAIVGVDDAHGVALADDLGAAGRRVVRISAREALPGGVFAIGGWLYDAVTGEPTPILNLAEAPNLAGQHNAQNAAAAYMVGRTLGLDRNSLADGLKSFPGLAHRQQLVAVHEGVRFINDSKATNVAAAERALATFGHIHWIAGGLASEEDLAPLVAHTERMTRAYLIGEAAPRFAAALEGSVPTVHAGDLDSAVSAAAAAAVAGDVVLLSPACKAFDQFDNFEARGDAFCTAVVRLSSMGGQARRENGA